MSENIFSTQDNLINSGTSSAPIKDTTTATFQKDVLEESRHQTVLVDFWAPWCEPCKQLGPILEKAVIEAKGAVKLVKMNIDDHPSIAGQLGIQSIPAVVAFSDGRPVDAFMGVIPESDINAFIKKNSNDNQQEAIDAALTAAEEFVKAGDIVQAAELYSQLLQAVPDNIKAITGLAFCLLDMGEIDQTKAILETIPADKKADPMVSALEAKIALSEQIKTLGDPIELEQRIQQNPKDYQARFDMALICNAQGKRAEAADMLLAIMSADCTWNDDGARKQLLQFFEAWGAMDSVTLTARRKLSSLLFS